jgi:hypothetical protein
MGAAIAQKTTENAGPSTPARNANRASPRREASPGHSVAHNQGEKSRGDRDRGYHGQDEQADMRSHLAQKKVDKFRAKRASLGDSDSDLFEYSQDEAEPCGARCFSRNIREAKMPRGFKLPNDVPKYDGQQEPSIWLQDYLTTVRFHKGTKTTAMQCL